MLLHPLYEFHKVILLRNNPVFDAFNYPAPGIITEEIINKPGQIVPYGCLVYQLGYIYLLLQGHSMEYT